VQKLQCTWNVIRILILTYPITTFNASVYPAFRAYEIRIHFRLFLIEQKSRLTFNFPSSSGQQISSNVVRTPQWTNSKSPLSIYFIYRTQQNLTILRALSTRPQQRLLKQHQLPRCQSGETPIQLSGW
jgi:hypothetical protein